MALLAQKKSIVQKPPAGFLSAELILACHDAKRQKPNDKCPLASKVIYVDKKSGQVRKDKANRKDKKYRGVIKITDRISLLRVKKAVFIAKIRRIHRELTRTSSCLPKLVDLMKF